MNADLPAVSELLPFHLHSSEWQEGYHAAVKRLRADGYLLVSEAELATALHDHTLHNGIGGVDDSLAKAACRQQSPSKCERKAAVIFAALVAAQEKGA